jgi:hypothetical protein
MKKSKLTDTRKGETGEKQSQEHDHHSLHLKEIFHKEFVLAGQTVNSACYCDVLQRMSKNMRRIRPELW